MGLPIRAMMVEAIAAQARARTMATVAVPRKNRKQKYAYDSALYKHRVEKAFP